MNILITCPSFARHGGVRVILEIANRLTQWHHVTLFVQSGENKCRWFDISPSVVITSIDCMTGIDCLLIMSPHAIYLQNAEDRPKKIFLHLQMLEHSFKPKDIDWVDKCRRMYLSPNPMMSISKWNMTFMQRQAPTHYIGNGINTEHFPLSDRPKDGKTVLVEGWEGYNPAKDTDAIGPQVAARLKAQGYRIISYGQTRLKTLPRVPNEYIYKPSLAQMNRMYDRAAILVKASKYDARALAPLEAMTKGTVTARAIIEGDDDLVHDVNCLRTGYNVTDLYNAAYRLLREKPLRERLAAACREHVLANSWDYWISKINEIITA